MSSMRLFLPLLLLLLIAVALGPVRAARVRAVSSNYGNTPAALGPSIYELIDNSTAPGNSRFEQDIGQIYALQTLATANEFVLHTLGQKSGDGKGYTKVVLVVESFTQAGIGRYPDAVASTVNNNIRMNSDYLQDFVGDVKSEFTGILYHESTHVWQWTGNGMAPDGLINGIADYMRLLAGWPSVNWGNRGSGYRWDEGFEVTAYFLDYCNGLMEGFVPKLNAMMKDYYSDDFFVVLLGKSVDELWSDYQLACASPAPAPAPSC